jgi:hypothetical protein
VDVQSTVARFAPQTTYRAASTASASKRPSQEEQVFNKLAAFLLFAACLCFASIASAAVQEFGPDFHRFTIGDDKERSKTILQSMNEKT